MASVEITPLLNDEVGAVPASTQGALLAKNWFLNLIGQLFPLLAGVATVPYVVQGLGAERFGILSIAWVLLGYFGLFDLGMGRATTKFSAECMARGDRDALSGITWTTFWFQTGFGFLGALVAAIAIHSLANHFLNISPALSGESQVAFYILAASLPLVLGGNTFRGTLEAAQRFDVVNYIKIPANISVFLLPAISVPLGFRLPGIVFLLVMARFLATIAYLVACMKLFPALRRYLSFDSALVRPLLSFGGWVSVSNIIGPILVYVDRFFIGSILSMTAVSYYTAPFEAVSRAWVIPGSLTATLFPAFTSLGGSGSRKQSDELCARSLKSLLLLMGPMLLVVIVFSRTILRLWLGFEFEGQSALVLQVLSAGVLIGSLAFPSFSLLQGIGRPDLTAKFHIVELPIHIAALFFFVHHMGLVGAAFAWTLRVTVDAFLLFGASFRLKLMSLKALRESGFQRTVVAVLGFGASLELVRICSGGLLIQGLFVCIFLLSFGICTWFILLDRTERSLLILAFERLRLALGGRR